MNTLTINDANGGVTGSEYHHETISGQFDDAMDEEEEGEEGEEEDAGDESHHRNDI